MSTKATLSGPLGLSLGAIVIIGLVILIELPALVTSANSALGSGGQGPDSMSSMLTENQLAMTMDQERFNGRSFFYRPPMPPRLQPVIDTTPRAIPLPPPPPPKVDPNPVEPTYPRTYTGPDLQAIVGPTAFFRPTGGDLIIVTVGETHEDIELLGTEPPRFIELKYRGGGPYTVTLFEMATPEFLYTQIDAEAAAEDIIAATRTVLESEPLLTELTGWPAGTRAGDPIRVVYRHGPYEAAVNGMLRRANQAWLVLDVEGSDEPVEIYKDDILSVQNLKPRPPEPESDVIATESSDTLDTIPSANDNATAANTNATAANSNTTAVNVNATGINVNATGIGNELQEGSGDSPTNSNATGTLPPGIDSPPDTSTETEPATSAAVPTPRPPSTPTETETPAADETNE